MATPKITAVYPNPNQISVPIGAEIEVVFDQSVDLSTVKNNIVLYGKDKDYVSGPDGAKWITEGQSGDPFYLRSPGFGGVVECDYQLVYVDATGTEYSFGTEVVDPSQETAAGVTHKVVLKPKSLLREEMEYYLKIIGDSEGGSIKGVSKRTVYDVDHSGATSTTGEIIVYGGYTGSIDDVMYLEITSGGSVGEVEYRFWLDSDPSTIYEKKIASRRFRRLVEGVQIRFDGSDFITGDSYRLQLIAAEFLEKSYEMTFETSTDTIVEVPDTMSTSPIGYQLPANQQVGGLEFLEMDPENGATNQEFKDKKIILSFGEELDPATVTDDTVTVYAYPVSGIYSDTGRERELIKKLTVSGNRIIIEV